MRKKESLLDCLSTGTSTSAFSASGFIGSPGSPDCQLQILGLPRLHNPISTTLPMSMCSVYIGFPVGTSGKKPAYQCKGHKRCRFNPWVRKIPWRRAWQPTLVFLPGESHGQKSLAGYSPESHKESDTTKVTSYIYNYYLYFWRSSANTIRDMYVAKGRRNIWTTKSSFMCYGLASIWRDIFPHLQIPEDKL